MCRITIKCLHFYVCFVYYAVVSVYIWSCLLSAVTIEEIFLTFLNLLSHNILLHRKPNANLWHTVTVLTNSWHTVYTDLMVIEQELCYNSWACILFLKVKYDAQKKQLFAVTKEIFLTFLNLLKFLISEVLSWIVALVSLSCQLCISFNSLLWAAIGNGCHALILFIGR